MTTLKAAACSALASCLHESYTLWGWRGVVVAGLVIFTALWLYKRTANHDIGTES